METNETVSLLLKKFPRYYRSIQNILFLNPEQPLDGINTDICLAFNETCGIDIKTLKRTLLPSQCHDVIKGLSFLGEKLNCEKVFKLYQTEVGDCFVGNSLYMTNKKLSDFENLPLRFSNLDTLQRSLEMEYVDNDLVVYKFYIHTPEELPNGLLEGHLLRKPPSETYVAIKMSEIINQKGVIGETIEARQCRFPSEFLNQHKMPYSFSHCKLEQLRQQELKECHCVLPFDNIPEDIVACNISRYACVQKARSKLENKKNENACDIPTCLGMTIEIVAHFEDTPEDSKGRLIIDVLDKPTFRFIRRVSVSKLDLIGKKIYFQVQQGSVRIKRHACFSISFPSCHTL